MASNSDSTIVPIADRRIEDITAIALKLDVEQTRSELMPHLDQLILNVVQPNDVKDSLIELANQLGSFIEYVRGKEHANLLFPLLKRLATSEETAVREEAINSLKVIASGLGELQLRTEFIPKVVVVLASDDKSITSRKSACALLTTRYEEVPKESKNYLKCAFMTLCRDSEMEVQSIAVEQLAKLTEALDDEDLISCLIKMFDVLTNDPEKQVRLSAHKECINIVRLLHQRKCVAEMKYLYNLFQRIIIHLMPKKIAN